MDNEQMFDITMAVLKIAIATKELEKYDDVITKVFLRDIHHVADKMVSQVADAIVNDIKNQEGEEDNAEPSNSGTV